jgi:hypothetical protein
MKIFLTISITSIILTGLVYVINNATYNGEKKFNLKHYFVTNVKNKKTKQ